MGLSTWALKTDSLDLDPRSGFNVVSRELHTASRLRALHCWTWSYVLSRSICHAALHTAWIRIKAVWRQTGFWIRIPDLHWIWIQDPVWRAPMLVKFAIVCCKSSGGLWILNSDNVSPNQMHLFTASSQLDARNRGQKVQANLHSLDYSTIYGQQS